jgi:hypothetical protein
MAAGAYLRARGTIGANDLVDSRDSPDHVSRHERGNQTAFTAVDKGRRRLVHGAEFPPRRYQADIAGAASSDVGPTTFTWRQRRRRLLSHGTSPAAKTWSTREISRYPSVGAAAFPSDRLCAPLDEVERCGGSLTALYDRRDREPHFTGSGSGTCGESLRPGQCRTRRPTTGIDRNRVGARMSSTAARLSRPNTRRCREA